MAVTKLPWCLLLAVATVSTAFPITPRQSSTYGRLIVFGDSYSDDGNGAWIVSNMTWPADPAYYKLAFTTTASREYHHRHMSNV